MKAGYKDWVKYPTGKIQKGGWCDCCKRYNARNSTCSVLGVRDGKILMALRKRDPQKNYWALPGGYVDWGETVEECAEREFREETGFDIKGLKLLGVYSDPARDLDGRQNIDHVFIGEVKGGAKGEATDEVVEMKWFEPDKLAERVAFDHRKVIGDWLDKD